MRLDAAIRGDLEAIMQQEIADATGGVQRGIRRGQRLLKSRLRAQVRSAGLGDRLSKTWADKDRRGRPLFWENDGLNPAAMVRNNAPHIINAHMSGTVIRSNKGRLLAIPTPEALKMGGAKRRRRVSPANFRGGKARLRYVPRKNGPDLLVLDTGGKTKTGKYRKGSKTVVMFILVRQVRLKRRLPDVDGSARRVEGLLPSLILREYRTTPVRTTNAKQV